MLLLALASSCGGAAPEVRVWGALRAVMHAGKTGPVVAIADVVPGPHTYALGALAELRGEVLVLDDHVYVGLPAGDGRVRIDDSGGRDEKAALLVAAGVARWTPIPVGADVAPEALDDRVQELAAGAGLDTRRPFPFLVEGSLTSIEWHVLDGSRLPASATHDERMAAAVRGSLPTAHGRALGFYSTRDAGVYTHMGTRTHVHVLLPSEGLMAHADRLGIAAGSTLYLPSR
jgi:acetolactate decarboxylase